MVSCKHTLAEVLLLLLSCKLQLAEKELQVAMLKSIIRDSEDTAVLQQQLAEVSMLVQLQVCQVVQQHTHRLTILGHYTAQGHPASTPQEQLNTTMALNYGIRAC
jgi:hypothetical protein